MVVPGPVHLVDHRVAPAAADYQATWLTFDNATGATQKIADTRSTSTSLEAPPGLPTASGRFIEVDIAVEAKERPSWHAPVRTYFRREGSSWTLVGLERLPEGPIQPSPRAAN